MNQGSAPARSARSRSNRDFAAVAGLFATNGLAVGVFGGSLPGLRAHLSLAPGQIVGVLVAAAVCAVLAMNLSGPWSDRYGARLPALLGGVGMALGAFVLGAAGDYAWLLAGAGLLGLGNGAMDVAMNALGVSVEQERRGPVMSRLHGCFSIGNLVGALVVVTLGSLLAPTVTPRSSLWSVALLVAVALVLLAGVTPQSPHRTAVPAAGPEEDDTEGDGSDRPAGSQVPPIAWLLAAMAVCFGLTEGTAVDWSSLHVTDVAGVSPSAGAWGLACVAGFMVVIRLLGDVVVERLGRVTVVRASSAVALVGYALTAFTDGLVPVLVGWSLVGLGVGLIAPQIYGLAGHIGGARGLGVVVSFGYAAFLVGPALIGLVAAASDLQRAMLVPVVTAVGLIVMSARMPADPMDRTALGSAP